MMKWRLFWSWCFVPVYVFTALKSSEMWPSQWRQDRQSPWYISFSSTYFPVICLVLFNDFKGFGLKCSTVLESMYLCACAGWSIWIREKLHPASLVQILRPSVWLHPYRRAGHLQGEHTHMHSRTHSHPRGVTDSMLLVKGRSHSFNLMAVTSPLHPFFLYVSSCFNITHLFCTWETLCSLLSGEQ